MSAVVFTHVRLNTLASYAEAGRNAGKASRQNDAACSAFHTRWARSAIAMEHESFKAESRAAFDAAYSQEATPAPMPLS